MKILQITGMRSTKFGGLEKYFLEIAKVLHARNDKMIIAYNEPPSSKEYIKRLEEYGTEIIITDLDNSSQLRTGINFLNLLKDVKPDIVHMHFGKASEKWFMLPKLFRVKKTYRNIHSLPFPNGNISFLSKIKFKFTEIFCTKIIAVSKAVHRQVAATGCNNIEVYYIGTYITDSIRKKENTNNTTICCIACHDRIKGVDILLEALHKLKFDYKCTNFRCLQVGSNIPDETAELLRKCRDFDIEENVIWCGTRDDVPELLQQCDIYVQPSREEGIGIALMEAASAGLPLIGTNIGGIPEVINDGENGFLFPVGDSECLAKLLHTLHSDKELRHNMGKKAQISVKENFDITKNAREIVEKLYQL